MKNIFNTKHIIGLLLINSILASNLSADTLNDTHWLVTHGDSLYKIARTIFPDDIQKQTRFRNELVNKNPQAFKNGTANISVGEKLSLPEFAVKNKKPAVFKITKAPLVIPKPTPAEVNPPAITTPDPEDIIGQVIINVGDLSAENRGASRPLNRRSDIFQGDTISTGDKSHTQIRLKDGALLSLRPHTNLKIADFKYNGKEDGSERSLLELIKGGFRTITGAIGHKNKQSYQVITNIATIGIRGTHYTLVLCEQQSCSDEKANPIEDGLYGGVADGSIVVKNQSGVHQFNNDQFFKVNSIASLPVEFLQPPAILKTGPAKIASSSEKDKQTTENTPGKKAKSLPRRLPIIFETSQAGLFSSPSISVDDLNTPSVSDLEPVKAADGSGMLLGFLHQDASGITGAAASVVVAPINNNDIFLTDLTLPNGAVASRLPFAINEASFDPELGTVVQYNVFMASPLGVPASLVPSSLGGNPLLGVKWGRWNGEFTVVENGVRLNTREDFHFIYSENLTSPTQLAALGGLGANVFYGIDAGTLPTDHLGNVATSLPLITMNADFINGRITTYDANIAVGGNSYTASASNIPFQDLASGFNIQSLSAGCPSGGSCAGEASVLFVGNAAQGAMTSYQIEDTNGPAAVTGAALLTR